VALEGELHIGLRVDAGRIERVRITSSRPDVARSLLQGRSRAEIRAAVPLLFSVCGRSQAAASELACAAAAGEDLSAQALQRCRASVSAETVREGAWRTLLDWPQWIDEKPTPEAIAAARGSLTLQSGAAGEAGTEAIALAAFGVAAEDWLARQSRSDLERWVDAGQTAAARFIRRVRDDDDASAWPDRPANGAPLLGDSNHAAWIGEIARASDADASFARHPVWRGAPAETGALARLKSDPLIDELTRQSTSRLQLRFVARLRELALLLAGRASATVGAMGLAPGDGVGWVENARGLLIHRVRLEQGRVSYYGIVAPTEWNFHPAGALVSALSEAPAGDLVTVKQRTTLLVHSLDPCVACRVEFDDA
jgi:coenzyme F420-reducing hydrogenase alpha subunit